MRGKLKKQIALMLVIVMAVTSLSMTNVMAAKKTIRMSQTSVQLSVNKTKKITIKNSTGKKIQKVTWSISKGKKVVKLSSKTKKGVTIKGLKAGTAVVSAKIRTKSGTVTRKIKVTVKKSTKKKTSGSTQAGNTQKPSTSVGDNTQTTEQKPSVTPPEQKVPQEAVELLHYDMTCSEDGKTLFDKSGNGNDATMYQVDTSLKKDDALFLEKNAYIQMPESVFAGKDTLTISVWLKNYSGNINTSAMFVGTKENMPTSYWLLNPANPAGKMKSVMTNSVDKQAPYKTEVGISASVASQGVDGPKTGIGWNHYVTVITPDSITGYFNGQKVGSSPLNRKFSDFGTDLVAYIGKSSYPDVTYTGYVREVHVYEGIKTDAQIQELYKEYDMETIATGTKSEVFIADRADPFITKGEDGYYYFTASYPMNGFKDANGYDRIILRRSKTLEELKDAEEKVIFNQKDSDISHRFIWAPEMHYIGGKWYMFYAASGKANDWWDINCHVLMCTGQDPYNDSWEEKGKFQAAEGDNKSFTGFSLDMTYFECNGKSYVIWAQKPARGTSNLYMAQVNPEEPWKTITPAMLLTRPEYYWECISIPVNEGPAVLIHDGKVIVAYSASATGPEYCIGYMYADENADLLDISSWTKQKTPALTSEDLIDEYGPGHNSFTVDEEGNTVFVYHSRTKECYEGNCGYAKEDPLYDPCRSAHIRTVKWDQNGLPILNQ